MTIVVMPRLSDSMEEGTIVCWLKEAGVEVTPGDDIVEIETDKATMTYAADAGGALEIIAAEGTTVAVGEPIGRIGAVSIPRDAEQPLRPVLMAEGAGALDHAKGQVKASPVARRLATQSGLDLATVHGSGPGGRISKADVERHLAATDPSEAEPGRSDEPATDARQSDGVELTRLQRAVARAMSDVKAAVPDFAVSVEADMAEAGRIRSQLKLSVSADAIVPSVNDLIVKAAALALRRYPRVNATYQDGRLKVYQRVNVGLAVAGQDALVVPVIMDADRKSLLEIAAESRRLAERVRAGNITEPELSNGTFTVSNLGMYGVASFTAIINRGQAAILAAGEVRSVPVVENDRIAAGSRTTLTLTCDHRILYGMHAAQFLAHVRALLEAPVGLLEV